MERDMQENLCSFLHGKRYVIFLDGVSHEWDFLKDIVMTYSKDSKEGKDNGKVKGSRIIVTCREMDQKPGDAEEVFNLDRLTGEEEQNLFYHSLEKGKDDPVEKARIRELKETGNEIVQKCHGHPLLIQVSASVLKTKEPSVDSWKKLLRRLSKGTEKNIPDMIFDLSYQDLPTELKPLFLYCGIFPMNREIFVSELIQLLVAEKLVIQVDKSKKPDKIVEDYTDKLIERNLIVVPVDKSKKPEEIVEDYIDKLIERNLIQVFRRRSDGRVKSCGIQNILHEPCTRKAKEINFFCTGDAALAPTARRVVSDSTCNLSNQNRTAPKELRALFGFTKGMKLSMFIKTYASKLRFLQLLSIEVEYMAINIPVEIVELSRLIYLKLKGQFIKVPSSIRKMKRLQTLEVRSRNVPSSILKMKHLLHLTISGVIIVKWKNREAKPEPEVDLQNLRTLDFDYQYGYNLSPNSLEKLRSLKKLRVSIAKTLTLQALCNSIPSLKNLEDLKLRVGRESDIPSKVDFSDCKNLRTLCLFFDSGNDNITCSFKFPDKLVKVTLDGIRTEGKDPLEKLHKLPNLETIKLKKCTAGTIDFSGQENFPKLQTLILYGTHFKMLLPDEEGILPNLERFICKACRQEEQDAKIPKKLIDKLVPMTTEAEELINTRLIPSSEKL
ncbi:hypothetical protein CDL12_09277 [Handroanthus impetiginosus]|uniref:Uncharacterized protein n=1 Tax=Handroanthus impetiginosus TaxID=429701 RepID=A0A2G9HKL0_9LAMI|nr:hypothetical protein CDL12_09277 [Handroanthus impetiginosus]